MNEEWFGVSFRLVLGTLFREADFCYQVPRQALVDELEPNNCAELLNLNTLPMLVPTLVSIASYLLPVLLVLPALFFALAICCRFVLPLLPIDELTPGAGVLAKLAYLSGGGALRSLERRRMELQLDVGRDEQRGTSDSFEATISDDISHSSATTLRGALKLLERRQSGAEFSPEPPENGLRRRRRGSKEGKTVENTKNTRRVLVVAFAGGAVRVGGLARKEFEGSLREAAAAISWRSKDTKENSEDREGQLSLSVDLLFLVDPTGAAFYTAAFDDGLGGNSQRNVGAPGLVSVAAQIEEILRVGQHTGALFVGNCMGATAALAVAGALASSRRRSTQLADRTLVPVHVLTFSPVLRFRAEPKYRLARAVMSQGAWKALWSAIRCAFVLGPQAGITVEVQARPTGKDAPHGAELAAMLEQLGLSDATVEIEARVHSEATAVQTPPPVLLVRHTQSSSRFPQLGLVRTLKNDLRSPNSSDPRLGGFSELACLIAARVQSAFDS
jgi:hypothetical protein